MVSNLSQIMRLWTASKIITAMEPAQDSYIRTTYSCFIDIRPSSRGRSEPYDVIQWTTINLDNEIIDIIPPIHTLTQTQQNTKLDNGKANNITNRLPVEQINSPDYPTNQEQIHNFGTTLNSIDPTWIL